MSKKGTPRNTGGEPIPERVKAFATTLQKEAIDAINAAGGHRTKAAKALGIPYTTLKERLRKAQRSAARAGYSPEHDYTHPQPEGFHVKGVSTLYDAAGNVVQQWVKSNKDQEDRFELMREAVQSLAEPFKGRSDASLIKAPRGTIDDQTSIYLQGDPHIGLLAWAIETGADFDLEIAESLMFAAVDRLVSLAPPTRVGWLINIGDFFHTDNGTNRTMRSGHPLDVDSRYAKMARVGVRTQKRCIERALEKHAEVWCSNEIGNHDDYSSIWLSIALGEFYSNNPRVRVDDSPTKHRYKRLGNCLIGTTHGDTGRPADLPGIMSTDRREDWGECTHCHWYTGHVHHDAAKEFRGCTWESLRTLAARDAWHSAEGYRSMRDMKLDVWDHKRGRVMRHTVGVEELEGRAA